MAFLNKLGKKVAKSDKPTVKKGSGDPKKVKKAAKDAGIEKRSTPEPNNVKKLPLPPKRPTMSAFDAINASRAKHGLKPKPKSDGSK